ncbi:MAG: hypothetical protein ACO1OO_16930 [Flavisolibacter sp.]
MQSKSTNERITAILENVGQLVPEYLQNEADRVKANGNVAICILDEEGAVYGKIFGTDKVRGREAFRVAWTKASQVWITGMKTGEYERLVFTNEIDEHQYGIRKPDLIGWEGGQPVQSSDGKRLFIGFSGLRSESDLEIVLRSLPSDF